MNAEAIESTEIADWFTSRLVVNPSFISQNENVYYRNEYGIKRNCNQRNSV